MARQKQEKPIIVEARYALKRNGQLTGVVVYRIRASSWTPERPDDVYCTTVVNGVASSCTCAHREKSHKVCRHMMHCEGLERERREQRMMAAPLGDNREFSLMRRSA
jgi:hypothetical protein